MQRTVIVTLALLVLLLVVLFFTTVMLMNVQNPADVVTQEFRFRWTVRMVGTSLALVAALALLVTGIAGSGLMRVPALVISLLAGLLVAEPQWYTALAVAALCLAVVVREILVARWPSHTP